MPLSARMMAFISHIGNRKSYTFDVEDAVKITLGFMDMVLRGPFALLLVTIAQV